MPYAPYQKDGLWAVLCWLKLLARLERRELY